MEDLTNAQEALFAQLDALGISHKTYTHRAVFTVEDSAGLKAGLPGGHTKNLFLKDKKGALFLVNAIADTQIPVNRLHTILGCQRLSFGKPDLLEASLGVTPGSVTFFAILNDAEGRVRLVLDKKLFDYELVNFHPLLNTATTAIKPDDLPVFARACGCEPFIVDFDSIS